MSWLNDMLFPDPYAGDMKRNFTDRGFSQPSRGSDMSIYLSDAREEGRQQTLGGMSSGVGALIQALTYLQGKKKKRGEQFTSEQAFAASQMPGQRNTGDQSFFNERAPMAGGSVVRNDQSPQIMRLLMQLIRERQTPSSGGTGG